MATCPAFGLSMTIVHLLIVALCVWRIGNMLADTDQSGPFELLDRLRALCGVRYSPESVAYAKHGSLGSMLLCVDCNSVWIGLAATVGYLINPGVTVIVSLPFALSALAKIIETLINRE